MANKPYFFIASEKDAWKISKELIRVQLARFFHCSPAEFDAIPERRVIEWVGIIEAILEKEGGQDG